MSRNRTTIPQPNLAIGDPCPCCSNKPVQECCLDADGTLRVKVPSLVPPGPPTQYANPKCYLSQSLDCSKNISREHYVSKAILELMGGEIAVTGVPWQPPGTTVKYGINSLVSKILCDRHNSALSPLDSLAAQVFKTIKNVCDHLNHRSLSRRTAWHLASGEALELWCIKTLLGLFFSAVASKEGESLIYTYSVDVQGFAEALRLRRLPPDCGVYGRLVAGEYKGHLAWTPLFDDDAKRVIGIRLRMCAVEFEVFLDPLHVNFDAVRKEATFRPWNLIFSDGKRTHVVVLSWPDKPEGDRRHINYHIRPMLPAL